MTLPMQLPGRGFGGSFLAMAFLAALLAGCAAPEDGAAENPRPGEALAVAAGPGVSWLNGTYTDIRDSGLVQSTADKVMRFNVTGNATAIVAEIRWDDPDAAVDLYVYSPRFCDGSTGPAQACSWVDWWTFGAQDGSFVGGGPGTWEGVQYRRIDISAAEIEANQCTDAVCTWRAVVGSEKMVDTPFEMAVSVFTEGTAAAEYTAFT